MIKTIYLAGGCFWGVQHYFDQFDGIPLAMRMVTQKTQYIKMSKKV